MNKRDILVKWKKSMSHKAGLSIAIALALIVPAVFACGTQSGRSATEDTTTNGGVGMAPSSIAPISPAALPIQIDNSPLDVPQHLTAFSLSGPGGRTIVRSLLLQPWWHDGTSHYRCVYYGEGENIRMHLNLAGGSVPSNYEQVIVDDGVVVSQYTSGGLVTVADTRTGGTIPLVTPNDIAIFDWVPTSAGVYVIEAGDFANARTDITVVDVFDRIEVLGGYKLNPYDCNGLYLEADKLYYDYPSEEPVALTVHNLNDEIYWYPIFMSIGIYGDDSNGEIVCYGSPWPAGNYYPTYSPLNPGDYITDSWDQHGWYEKNDVYYDAGQVPYEGLYYITWAKPIMSGYGAGTYTEVILG